MDYRSLYAKTVAELRAMAREEKIKIPAGASKAKIVELLLEIENARAAELAMRQADAQRSAEEKLAEKKAETIVQEPPRKKRGRPPKAKTIPEDTIGEENRQPEPVREQPKAEPQPVRIGGYTVRRNLSQAALRRTESSTPEMPHDRMQNSSSAPEHPAPAVSGRMQRTSLESEHPIPVSQERLRRSSLEPEHPVSATAERMQKPSTPQNFQRPIYNRPEQRDYPRPDAALRSESARPEYANRTENRGENMRPENPYRAENRPDFNAARRETFRQEQPRFVRRDFVPQDPADITRTVSDLLAAGDCAEGGGVLEPMPDGYGFLRAENYQQGTKDVYVSAAQIRRFDLRMGDLVRGKVRPQREGDRYTGLLFIDTVNGQTPDKAMGRPRFEDLTPVYPQKRIRLEGSEKSDMALRVIDLLAPIGRGQRAMIVSQPKAGKTVLLKKIANAITENEPDIELIVLLIDERPEEVTDMQRSIKGDVVYSTFDEMPENHTRVAEMVLERAQRLVEQGKDVVILLDSITRLARAYNLVIPPTGRTLSGGIDPGALHKPKRFFGAARNIENGGSLTIIATALVETGSRMDDIIFEEFKGTGNSEIHLDRRLSEKRIFPAIDMNKSGTRRDDLLFTPEESEGALTIRRMLSGGSNQDAVEQLMSMLHKTQSNAEFFQMLRNYFAQHEKDGFTYGGR